MSFVHFMVQRPNGWVTASEADGAGGHYVVPIKDGELQETYQIEITQYLGAGQRTPKQTIEVTQKDGIFSLQIAGQKIEFHKLKRIQKYVGKFNHGDFADDLVEIDIDPTILDKLLDETGYVLIGCEPANYCTRVT